MGLIAIALLREPYPDEVTETKPDLEEKVPEVFSVKPTQALKTGIFYKMWFAFLALTVIIDFFSNYQKSLGQIFIHDDRFFAIIGTLCSVMNGLARILWGFTYDKKGFQVIFMTSLV